MATLEMEYVLTVLHGLSKTCWSRLMPRRQKVAESRDIVRFASNGASLTGKPLVPLLLANSVVDTRTGVLREVELTPYSSAQSELHPGLLPSLWTAPLLERACTVPAILASKFGISARLCLNVTPAQFNRQAFCRELHTAMLRSQLDPSILDLGFSEQSLSNGHSTVTEMSAKLRSLGVGLALCSYGQGAAPLRLFEHFEFTSVRLAAQLVSRLIHPLRQPHYPVALVSSVVEMARLLDFEVVASGITSFEQARTLQALRCELQQGPFYASPIVLPHDNPELAFEAAWPWLF